LSIGDALISSSKTPSKYLAGLSTNILLPEILSGEFSIIDLYVSYFGVLLRPLKYYVA